MDICTFIVFSSAAHIISVDAKSFYIRGPMVEDCEYEGNPPTGRIVNPGQITDPLAARIASVLSLLFTETGQEAATANLPANVSPEMASILAVFGSVFSAASKPKLSDVKSGIANLTDDINNQLKNMGYAGKRIEYTKEWNIWLKCINVPSKQKAKQCQKDAEKPLSIEQGIFEKFATIGRKEKPLAQDQLHVVETQLTIFRLFSLLHIMELKGLVDSYVGDKSYSGRTDYQKYSKKLYRTANFLIKYSEDTAAAVSEYRKHQVLEECRRTCRFTRIKSLHQGSWPLNAKTVDYGSIYCILDNATKQRCVVSADIRVDGKKIYRHYNYDVSSTNEALKENLRRNFNVQMELYARSSGVIVRRYWQRKVLDLIPGWRAAARYAGKRMEIESDELTDGRSEGYSGRYYIRKMLDNNALE